MMTTPLSPTRPHGRTALRTARLALAAAALGAALAGCSSTSLDTPSGAPVENRNVGANAGTGGAGTSGGQSRVAPVDLAPGANDALGGSQRIVYFDFDSDVIQDPYRPIVERFGKALSADRKRQLRVEGHTDERGGREYNLALGQRRAEAVARALTLSGAAANQVEAVSFGKERPAVQGNDEAAWAKNRRAELKDR